MKPLSRRMEWESEFFKFPVARIVPPRLDETTLRSVLASLKKEGVKLVDWPAEAEDTESHAAAEALGGFLADQKITYAIDYSSKDATESELPQPIRFYEGKEATPELIDLGLQSSEFSRFRIDPKFPDEQCDAMYRLWTEKCVRGELADRVLIAPDGSGTPRAMLAAGEKDGRGNIVLIGVDRNHRGKGFGTLLMQAARLYFFSRGLTGACVVTQQANSPSCRLYENSGFHLERRNHVYHFWLS